MEKEIKESKTKGLNWSDLSKEDRRELMEIADSLFIPPQFVSEIYESGQLSLTSSSTKILR